jgi:hypothetical protein
MATRSRRAAGAGGGGGNGVGEFRSGPIAGTALLTGVTFTRRPVLYAEVDGEAVFEGDIILGPADLVRAASDAGPGLESIGITGSQFRWPNATVPYTIAAGLPNQQRITDAIAHWESRTRIRFVLRTAANASQHPNWVNFQSGGGCSSMVGMRGGQQNINLGSGCGTGNTIHEIGHALGLWHEQSREDRDTFVRIEWANIDPATTHNFSQHVTDGDDLGPYDYGSIMHYPPTAFSVNGQPTIVALQALPPGVVMGQRDGLSQGDIDGIHAMYPQPGMTIKEVAKDPVFDGPIGTFKEASSDPVTIKELRKDPITDVGPTRKELIKEPLKDPATDPGPTRKEVAFDPPFTLPTGITPIPIPRPDPRASTFVTGAPSRAGGQGDVTAQLATQVEQLGAALAEVEQQHVALAQAYDAAVAALAQQQGQG